MREICYCCSLCGSVECFLMLRDKHVCEKISYIVFKKKLHGVSADFTKVDLRLFFKGILHFFGGNRLIL